MIRTVNLLHNPSLEKRVPECVRIRITTETILHTRLRDLFIRL